MFVAKFNRTSGEPFVADKNGNYPVIGTVTAGTATGSLMNGTMFQREGLEENQLYLCDNSIDPEYPDNIQTQVIGKVSVMEFVELRTKFGAPKITVGTVANEAQNAPAVANEA